MKSIVTIAVAILFLALTGCKHDVTSSGEADFAFDESDPSGIPSLTDLLTSKAYTGEIEVKFKDEAHVRLRGGKWTSRDSKLTSLLNSIQSETKLTVKRRDEQRTEAELTANWWRLYRRTGVKLSDPNSYYRIPAKDPKLAATLITKLKTVKEVEQIDPIMTPQQASIIPQMGVEPDPLFNEQNYLQSYEEAYGLNIIEAWADSKGEGITSIVTDNVWNVDHVDLGVDKGDIITDTDACLGDVSCETYSHGTAVLGILGGVWSNGTEGINGIAPATDFKMHSSTYWFLYNGGPYGGIGSGKTNGGKIWKVAEGDVVMVNDAAGDPEKVSLPVDQTGTGSLFNMSELGLVVVQAGGNGDVNGSINLDSIVGPDDDNGSILVGAIDPATGQKTSYSNCGKRVDAAAWGWNVVTTGYGGYGLALQIEAIDSSTGEGFCIPAKGVPGYNDETGLIDNVAAASTYIATQYPSWNGKKGTVQVVIFCKDGGYIYDDDPQTPELPTPNDPNKFYTKTFKGTSASTPMVAGGAILIQSKVKKDFNDGSTTTIDGLGTFEKKVFFTSKQMRTILKETGHDVPNDDACPVGVVPDIKKAMDAVKSGQYIPTFRILLNGTKVADITGGDWSKGYTNEVVVTPADPIRGKKYDVDGDGRADLVRFEQDRWVIDLSSKGTTEDQFGSDDVSFTINTTDLSSMVFPVVADYNGDGMADMALYDSLKGNYYIKYSTESVMASPPGTVIPLKWDKLIDYSTFTNWKPFARPVPGYYNSDDWLDIAFQGPQDKWWIDYGKWEYPIDATTTEYTVFFKDGDIKGPLVVSKKEVNELIGAIKDYLGQQDDTGTAAFDEVVTYLSPDLYAQAPGWAFLGVAAEFDSDGSVITFKHPDGIPTAGQTYFLYYLDDPTIIGIINKDLPNYGGNETILIPGNYNFYSSYDSPGYKNNLGEWTYLADETGQWYSDPLVSADPPSGYGSVNCRPVPADYDGDKTDDLAVQCNTEGKWKIIYSDSVYDSLKSGNDFREVNFTSSPWILPGCTFPGGIEYQKIKGLYTTYKTQIENEWKLTCADEFDTPTCPFNPQYPEFSKPWAWPPPVGPFFAQCVAEQPKLAPNLPYCWDK